MGLLLGVLFPIKLTLGEPIDNLGDLDAFEMLLFESLRNDNPIEGTSVGFDIFSC